MRQGLHLGLGQIRVKVRVRVRVKLRFRGVVRVQAGELRMTSVSCSTLGPSLQLLCRRCLLPRHLDGTSPEKPTYS